MNMTSWQMLAVGEPIKKIESTVLPPKEDEVVVKVAGCGVCHTDLGFYYDGVRTKSPMPLTLGHEISGIVISTGADCSQWMDKAVIVPAVMPCGNCDLCKRGMGNICRTQKMPGNDIQGGFASHIIVPAGSLCPVEIESIDKPVQDSGCTLAELSVIADAVTTPYQSVIDSELTAEDTAVFVGIGGVGGFGAQIAKALGAAVVAVDIDPERLDALAPYVDLTLNVRDYPGRDLRKAVSSFVKENGRRPTEWKIFETSGTAAGQKTAFGLLTFGASLAIVGFTMDKLEIRLSNLMAFHATARGSWGCQPKYYAAALELATSGKIKIAPFVETFSLDQINEVFQMVHDKKIAKRPVLIP